MRLCVVHKFCDPGNDYSKITITTLVKPARFASSAPTIEGDPNLFQLGGMAVTWYSNSIDLKGIPVDYTFKKSIYLKDLKSEKMLQFTRAQIKSTIKNTILQDPTMSTDRVDKDTQEIHDFFQEVYSCEDFKDLQKAIFLLSSQSKSKDC